MKIATQRKTKKYFLIILFIVLFIISGLATYIFAFNGSLFGWPERTSDSTDQIDYNKPTNEQIQAGNDIKKEQIENNSKPSSGSNTDQSASTPLPSPSGQKTSISMTITAANQNDTSFQIRSLISTVTNDGTCTLTLTQGTKTITKTAGVQAAANSSTCKGFDIPLGELSVGSWQAAIRFENNVTIAETSQKISIN